MNRYAGWIGTIAARHRLTGTTGTSRPHSHSGNNDDKSTTRKNDVGNTSEEGTVSTTNSLSPPPTLTDSHHRLAAVAGTSSCYLAQTPTGVFVPGVWGPYKVIICLNDHITSRFHFFQF